MRFSICNEIFEGWELSEIFQHAAGLGYDAVELAPFTLARSVTDLSSADRVRIREEAEQAGIRISGLHWVLVRKEGVHLTHPDVAIRERTAEYLVQLVDFCGDVGGEVVVFGSPKQRELPGGVSVEQGRQWAAEALRPAVRRAEARGVIICLEPLSPAETNFINTAGEACAFVRPFESPALRVILDVKAMCSEGKPIPEIIAASRDELAYFHANDRNRKGPGFGDVDYRPIAAALRSAGYDGYISVEVFDFEEGPETIAANSIRYLKGVFG